MDWVPVKSERGSSYVRLSDVVKIVFLTEDQVELDGLSAQGLLPLGIVEDTAVIEFLSDQTGYAAEQASG